MLVGNQINLFFLIHLTFPMQQFPASTFILLDKGSFFVIENDGRGRELSARFKSTGNRCQHDAEIS